MAQWYGRQVSNRITLDSNPSASINLGVCFVKQKDSGEQTLPRGGSVFYMEGGSEKEKMEPFSVPYKIFLYQNGLNITIWL